MRRKGAMTVAEAREAGLLDGLMRNSVRKRKKDTSVASGPYRWRCACGVEGDSHASADRHVAPGHNRFETITEENHV